MPEHSAGLLLWRRGDAGIEVWIAHMGGPFWASKQERAWSIPKGLADPGEDLRDVARREFAEEIGVPMRDVEMMEARLAGSDFSLNAQQSGEEGREWVESLEDDTPQAAETVEREADLARVRVWLADALRALNQRERLIIAERKLRDEPRTLESLGQQLGLSKERVRQLEAQALGKLRRRLEVTTGTAAESLAGM